ncbi:hypothetical protein AVEN_179571-1 [Araneus ventricosus]|uniref:Uncharacterized protein n=1 Tax=Araneus ventricosus TaxID=182803 RepID=A0A4Y2BCP0_ARAVE|nr:hypothetical protein AVEN_179571-1 [Araneus ventricosus]
MIYVAGLGLTSFMLKCSCEQIECHLLLGSRRYLAPYKSIEEEDGPRNNLLPRCCFLSFAAAGFFNIKNRLRHSRSETCEKRDHRNLSKEMLTFREKKIVEVIAWNDAAFMDKPPLLILRQVTAKRREQLSELKSIFNNVRDGMDPSASPLKKGVDFTWKIISMACLDSTFDNTVEGSQLQMRIPGL